MSWQSLLNKKLLQIASEPQACGTPVVAFNTIGFPDVTEDRITVF